MNFILTKKKGFFWTLKKKDSKEPNHVVIYYIGLCSIKNNHYKIS